MADGKFTLTAASNPKKQSVGGSDSESRRASSQSKKSKELDQIDTCNVAGKVQGKPDQTTKKRDSEGSAATESVRSDEQGRAPRTKKRRLSQIELLFGETVRNAAGDEVSPRKFAVVGGVIALYFAAHWCPPCRMVFPRLSMLYHELHKKELFFEVIFVSLDSTESSFEEYMSTMPWYAIPYENEEKRDELVTTFGVMGIPFLILLDASSLQVISTEGRRIIEGDPRGDSFPWYPVCEEETTSEGLPLKDSKTASAPKDPKRTSTQNPVAERQNGALNSKTTSEKSNVDKKKSSSSSTKQPASLSSTVQPSVSGNVKKDA